MPRWLSAMTTPASDGARAISVVAGPIGVLVLHGYTGSPASVRPLGEAFVRHGYSVEVPLLPGHGGSLRELLWGNFSEWLAAATSAFEDLAARCNAVVVAGHSMGGTLACTLALGEPRPDGLILINPFIEPPAPEFVSMMYAALDAGVESVPSIGSDLKKDHEASRSNDATPIRPMLTLFEAAARLEPRLSEISTSVLLFSSRVDHVVSPRSSDLVEARVGGPIERIVLEESYHLATLDNDAHEIEARSVEFIEKVSARQ